MSCRRGDTVLADKAYDNNALRTGIAGIGAETGIPSNRIRKIAIAYKLRNHIERHFCRFATRYEHRTIHFISPASFALPL